MADERLKLVVDPGYAAALGVALFAFATLESKAVWCCELIHPGSIADLQDRTAGNVADRLNSLVEELPDTRDQQRLGVASQRFQQLVKVRNSLFHAKPIDVGGTNILSRKGDPWELHEIHDAADEFARCALALDVLLHSYLKPLRAPQRASDR